MRREKNRERERERKKKKCEGGEGKEEPCFPVPMIIISVVTRTVHHALDDLDDLEFVLGDFAVYYKNDYCC